MLGDARVRIVVLLGVLVGLSAYALTTKTDLLGGDSGSATAETCPINRQPSLPNVDSDELTALRSRALAAFPTHHLDPYEEGPVDLSVAWTDAEPGRSGVPGGGGPSGFELRWWAPSGDDIGVDVWRLSSAEAASKFIGEAARGECRTEALSRPSSHPPGTHNLQWRNPDGYFQQDAFLSRGRTAYRVVIVRPGSESRPSIFARLRAFRIVDELAGGIPGAGWSPESALLQ